MSNSFATCMRVVLFPLLVLPLVGQAPTYTASGTMIATFNGVTQQFAGAIPPSGAQAYSPGFGLSVALASASPAVSTPGSLPGYYLSMEGISASPNFGSYDVSSDVVLTITSAPNTPGNGVLRMFWQRSTQGSLFGPPALAMSIDIGNDGTIEFAASLSSTNAQATIVQEFAIGAASGVPVRVRQSATGGGSSVTRSGRSAIWFDVTPGASPITTGAAGCFPLTHTRTAPGSFELSCSPPSGSPTIFLFGRQPLTATLPWAPACPLLLQLETAIPAVMVGGVATLPLSNVVLPPGLTFHTQAIAVVNSNDVRSTNALLMTGQ